MTERRAGRMGISLDEPTSLAEMPWAAQQAIPTASHAQRRRNESSGRLLGSAGGLVERKRSSHQAQPAAAPPPRKRVHESDDEDCIILEEISAPAPSARGAGDARGARRPRRVSSSAPFLVRFLYPCGVDVSFTAHWDSWVWVVWCSVHWCNFLHISYAFMAPGFRKPGSPSSRRWKRSLHARPLL